ncbi:tensin-2 isoform X5 [Zootermopsis nevadensis]|uniref:tensin-2 isoform X5 n=1 Tax=Zootermopsis nevadensis TaxID=136037 RepID=UPI000B8EE0A8|nr:tensin-2 isoform X5 [Zootermopsis nevadensis]
MLENYQPEADTQSHTFRCKVFKRPRPCNLCHQPIHHQGSCCRVCKYVCHKACENKGAVFRHPRFADTSLQIHRQWQRRQLATFPSVAASDETHSYDAAPTKNPAKTKQPTALTSQPRGSSGVVAGRSPRHRGEAMDLSYVTERIIALWVPGDVSPVSYRQGQQKAAHMLHTKHGNNYMVFNLSEPRRVTRSHHERVRELGWPSDLAPPLERLCSVCKDIESWLSEDSRRIAVIHARGSKDRIGVVIAAYMHYSSICGSADQALDRFAMSRYLEDKVGDLEQPSHKRYVEYFSGLLSGSIRINSAPLYLTHVTVLGAPAFEPAEEREGRAVEAAGGCRAFLKVYEGLIPVYTSGVYSVCGGTRQFTVNVASERQRRGLQLRGDILLKCYHRHYNPVPTGSPSTHSPVIAATERPQRELIFACQFHTCAVTDYTLSFTRQELDFACSDLRFPLDGAVELHFSATPEIRLPSPAPTPAVPVDTTDDPVTRWDSYENLVALGSPLDGDTDIEDTNGGEEAEVSHTFGPLDGSLYATISKKQQQELEHQQEQRQREETPVRGPQQELTASGAVVIGSPHTVSMDSGISSAGNGLLLHKHHQHHSNSNNTSNASSASPPPPLTSLNGHGGSLLQPSPSTSTATPLSPQDHHRALDELLNDMLLTVENIPDLPPSATSPYGDRSFTMRHVATLNDLQPPRPFQHHHSPPSVASCDVINLPLTARTASTCSNIPPVKQLHNGYGASDTSAPGGSGDRTNATNTSTVLDDLVDVNYIDDTETDENIPYHARQNSSPFTYGAIPTSPQQQQQTSSTAMLQMHPGLASPSLVRKASFRGGAATPKGSPVSSTTTLRQSSLVSSAQPSPPEDFVDGDVSDVSPTRDYRYNGASSTSPRSPEFHDGHIVGITSNASINNLTWLQRQQQKLRERKEVQMRTERYPQESRLITELRTIQQHSYNRVLRPSASHRADGYTSDTTHFADEDDDQEDFTIPLHINTTTSPTHKLNSVGSAPASPLLPNRTSSRRYYGTSTTPNLQSSSASYLSGGTGFLGRQKSDSSFDRERPFVAVKRAHEQSRKFKGLQSPPTSPQAVLAAHPLGLALTHHGELSNKEPQTDSAGLLTMVEEQRQHQQQMTTLRRGAGGGVGRSATNTTSNSTSNNNHQDALASLIASLAATSAPVSASSNTNSTAWQQQLREDSFSSWRTTSMSDETGSPPRSSSPRPQTPAFPVHPRTPYVNSSSQQFDPPTSSTGLPPKSPTTQRRLSNSGSFKNLRKWPSNSSVSSKDRSPSPVSDLPPANTVPQQNISITSTSSGGSSNGRGVIGVNTTGFPTTSHSSVSISDGSYPQQSPKNSALQNGSTGQSSPTVYYGHSRRSSLHSNSEPPQEVSPAHVKFVRDTSRFWYKPTISREEAINMLRDQAPGTFVVRDSNSFPGAFGLALKVAVPPPNLQSKTNDPASELVRHFLIEPTSRGVKLKGCSNEPVFSSLSALVYQHSLMPMALPCRLLLPESDGSRLPADSPGTISTAQLLLAQGAACNVLYLYTLDTESLTGPQAIKKAVQHMFSTRPLPTATVVHFKVSGQGITLTDNKRQLFFRRHYPVTTISYCGLDPDDHRWSQKSDETGMPISSNRCFGFVARKPASKTDNQCHIFAELEPEQPASAIVNFVSKVMMSGASAKANIV